MYRYDPIRTASPFLHLREFLSLCLRDLTLEHLGEGLKFVCTEHVCRFIFDIAYDYCQHQPGGYARYA